MVPGEPDSGEPGGNQAAERYASKLHMQTGRDHLENRNGRFLVLPRDESRNGPDGGQQDAERGEAGTE